MKERAVKVSEQFLVAVDKKTGKCWVWTKK